MHKLFFFILFDEPATYFTYVILMALSICIHEFAHSWVANWEGDDTGKQLGFMTMNPSIVMGKQSMIALLLFGIAWGRVPIVPSKMRHSWGDALTSFAGPGANLLLAVFFSRLSRIFPEGTFLIDIAYYGVSVNALLAVFNLLPLPTLDGWHICRYFFPALDRISAERCNMILLIGIILLWCSPLSFMLHAIVGAIVSVLI